MILSEVIGILRGDGFNGVTAKKIRFALETGRISPKPKLDAGLRYDWRPRNIQALRRYFEGRKSSPQRPAGKAKATEPRTAASAA
jgi:hypothetical protein